MPCPAPILGVIGAIRLDHSGVAANVECGSLLPPSAVRACPDVLPAFSTCSIAPERGWLTAEHAWLPAAIRLAALVTPSWRHFRRS
jgi:hypothetical protein